MVWLLNSQGIQNCKSTESFCRSILAIYTNDWFTFWYVYCCYVYFFSGKFWSLCQHRTKSYPLWQPGPAGLAFYGSVLACLPSWLGIVNAGSLCSMRSEIFLQTKFIIFQGCPTKLWQPAPYIPLVSQLLSIMRLSEHFGIYSQLDSEVHKQLGFLNKSEVPEQLGLEKQMKKMGLLVLFSYLLPDLWSYNCQKLYPFCNFLLISEKNLRLLYQFMYMHQKVLVSLF